MKGDTIQPVAKRGIGQALVFSRRLGLISEASQRFERGVDANGCDIAPARAAQLIAETGGGEVAPGVVLVDAGYVGPGCAAAWLVRGGETAAVVETGTALSVPRVLSALAVRGIAREEVGYVVVTHVHLDHAGGAGALLRELPRARLVAHPRGTRHLIDPSRLLAGSAEVYGGMEALTRLYGEVVPAPAERVVEAPDGFRVDLGGRPLVFLDAPGHVSVWLGRQHSRP